MCVCDYVSESIWIYVPGAFLLALFLLFACFVILLFDGFMSINLFNYYSSGHLVLFLMGDSYDVYSDERGLSEDLNEIGGENNQNTLYEKILFSVEEKQNPSLKLSNK